MITLRFERLALDGDTLEDDWDLLLRITADFSIEIAPAPFPLYRDEAFCVVEFAMQITRWLARVHRDPIDFSYNSMESDEADLVAIRKEAGGWRIAALHQDYVEERIFLIEEIESAVNATSRTWFLGKGYNFSLSNCGSYFGSC